MDVINLIDFPSVKEEIASWHFSEWGALYPHSTLEEFIEDLDRSLATDDVIPSTWLLMENDSVIGTACFVEQDMDIETGYGPWLANIFIVAEKRGVGLGREFVRSVMDKASEEGVGRVYLYTPDQAAFYGRLGWRILEYRAYHGKDVSIMTIDLSARPSPVNK